MASNKKIKVGLIYGGASEERDVSAYTAGKVTEFLDPKKYTIVPIEISAAGVWPKRVPLEKLSKLIDVAFVAMHGPGGEDGTMQGFLETLGIPYTCSGVLASAVAMDKFRAAMLVQYAGMATPASVMVRKSVWALAKKALLADIKQLGKKVVVKPNRLGSSVGVSIIKNQPAEVEKVVAKTFKYCDEVLVQEYIMGKEITAGVVGNARPQALPLIEIIPSTGHGEFYDYEAKYSDGGSEHVIPASLPAKVTQQIQQMAVDAHELLGCRGASRSDFLVDKNNNVYFLEINTIPGMTQTSLLPQAAQAAKISFPKLLDTLLTLALKN